MVNLEALRANLTDDDLADCEWFALKVRRGSLEFTVYRDGDVAVELDTESEFLEKPHWAVLDTIQDHLAYGANE